MSDRDAGVKAYRDGDRYLPGMNAEWRRGWLAARNQYLRERRELMAQARRPLAAPAPLIDMAKLERMRMGGR